MDVQGTLRSFGEMWYQIFLWCLATSVFIHCISASVAFLALRKHSRGVFLPLLVIFIGFLYPVTGGVITSATIAAVYQTAHFTMPRYASFLWGAGQAFIGFLVSYTRVLATLWSFEILSIDRNSETYFSSRLVKVILHDSVQLNFSLCGFRRWWLRLRLGVMTDNPMFFLLQ